MWRFLKSRTRDGVSDDLKASFRLLYSALNWQQSCFYERTKGGLKNRPAPEQVENK